MFPDVVVSPCTVEVSNVHWVRSSFAKSKG